MDQYLGTADGPLDAGARRPPSLGLREAFLRAGEAALDPANHAVLQGTAPAGRVLRLHKAFTTSTSYVLRGTATGVPSAGAATALPEALDSTLTVPATGRFRWDVDPSTRPVAALAGRTEAWQLTCEDPATGAVLGRRAVVVGFGGAARLAVPCTGATLAVGAPPAGRAR